MTEDERATTGSDDPSYVALDFGIALLGEALHVLETADLPLAASYVQLALDISLEELERRKTARS